MNKKDDSEWWQRYHSKRKKIALKTENKRRERDVFLKRKQKQKLKSRSQSKKELKEIISDIQEKRETDPATYEIGKKREVLFEEALESLRREKKISGYAYTGLGYSNIKRGIDVYVRGVDGKGQYETYCIDVTGPEWVEKKQKHPTRRRIVIGIELQESIQQIKEKILRGILGGARERSDP